MTHRILCLMAIVSAACSCKVALAQGSRSAEPLVEDRSLAYTWGDWTGAIPDLDGDGVGEVVVASGVWRDSGHAENSETEIAIHSGLDGSPLGRVAGLPFVGGTMGVSDSPFVLHDVGHVVLGGCVRRGERIGLAVACIDPTQLAATHIQVSSDVGLARAESQTFARALVLCAPHGDAPRVFVLSAEWESGRLLGGVTNGMDPLAEWGDWTSLPSHLWTGAEFVHDVDADGARDVALSVVPIGMESPATAGNGQVLLVSATSGEILSRIAAPPGAGAFAQSIALVPRVGDRPELLAVGAPGRVVGTSSGGLATREAGVFVVDLDDGSVPRFIALERVDPDRSPARIVDPPATAPEQFGRCIRAAVAGERRIVAIGDPFCPPGGAILGVDIDTGERIWTVMGDDGRLGRHAMGDVDFGGAISTVLAGPRPVAIVAARRWRRGRVVAIDLANGEEVFELRPPL